MHLLLLAPPRAVLAFGPWAENFAPTRAVLALGQPQLYGAAHERRRQTPLFAPAFFGPTLPCATLATRMTTTTKTTTTSKML